MRSTMRMRRDHDGVSFSGKVYWDEYPRLDALDSRIVGESGGPTSGAADWLLALEVIFRRLAEQQAARTEEKPR